mmetsp:Transcript_53611/g.114498  ORF Transcript_53611/g.114498 Transcript_53611/m.114498 type:complete len:102 (-) Transcript_53611:286-591(-)
MVRGREAFFFLLKPPARPAKVLLCCMVMLGRAWRSEVVEAEMMVVSGRNESGLTPSRRGHGARSTGEDEEDDDDENEKVDVAGDEVDRLLAERRDRATRPM